MDQTDPRCVIIQCMIEIIEPKDLTLIDIAFNVSEAGLNIDKVSISMFPKTDLILTVFCYFLAYIKPYF